MFTNTIVFECTCPPVFVDIDHWTDVHICQLHYLKSISNLLRATNQAWLADLREDKVSVFFAVNKESRRVIIHIHYKNEWFENANNHLLTKELNTRWGLLDLAWSAEVDWILKFKGGESLTEVRFV